MGATIKVASGSKGASRTDRWSLLIPGRSEPPLTGCLARRLRPVDGACLFENPPHVELDRVLAAVDFDRDLAVGAALDDLAQDLHLEVAQPGGRRTDRSPLTSTRRGGRVIDRHGRNTAQGLEEVPRRARPGPTPPSEVARSPAPAPHGRQPAAHVRRRPRTALVAAASRRYPACR